MNIRQVKKKMKSVGNVKKITRSMQLVSAIKMKKAQQEAIEARPYQEELTAIIQTITHKIESSLSPLLEAPDEKTEKELIICITTNKGLCGSFNTELFKYLAREVSFPEADFVVSGKKGALFISKMGGTVIADFSTSKPIDNVSAIFELAITKFQTKTYSKVRIFYNRFISTFKIESVFETILPFRFEDKNESIKWKETEYVIEPSPQTILDRLLKSYIEEKIRNTIIQTTAGEHSSRMIAMKNATDNAVDVMYNLNLLGNKLRQEKITGELLDMITAKESVEVG